VDGLRGWNRLMKVYISDRNFFQNINSFQPSVEYTA
jgi:hypothetical protein